MPKMQKLFVFMMLRMTCVFVYKMYYMSSVATYFPTSQVPKTTLVFEHIMEVRIGEHVTEVRIGEHVTEVRIGTFQNLSNTWS
jgi:hypothetical protein